MAEEFITKSLSIKETEHIARNRRDLLSCSGNPVYIINKKLLTHALYSDPSHNALSPRHTLSHIHTHKAPFLFLHKISMGGKKCLEIKSWNRSCFISTSFWFLLTAISEIRQWAPCMKQNICLREELESRRERSAVWTELKNNTE